MTHVESKKKFIRFFQDLALLILINATFLLALIGNQNGNSKKRRSFQVKDGLREIITTSVELKIQSPMDSAHTKWSLQEDFVTQSLCVTFDREREQIKHLEPVELNVKNI